MDSSKNNSQASCFLACFMRVVPSYLELTGSGPSLLLKKEGSAERHFKTQSQGNFTEECPGRGGQYVRGNKVERGVKKELIFQSHVQNSLGKAAGPGDSNPLPKSKERWCFDTARSIRYRPHRELLQCPVAVGPVRASSSETDEHTINELQEILLDSPHTFKVLADFQVLLVWPGLFLLWKAQNKPLWRITRGMLLQVSVIAGIQLSGVWHFKNMAPKFLDILPTEKWGSVSPPLNLGRSERASTKEIQCWSSWEAHSGGSWSNTSNSLKTAMLERPHPGALVQSLSWAPNWQPVSSVNHTTEYAGPAAQQSFRWPSPVPLLAASAGQIPNMHCPAEPFPNSSFTKLWATLKDHFKSLSFRRTDYPAIVTGVWSLGSWVISVEKVRRQLCWDSGHKCAM